MAIIPITIDNLEHFTLTANPFRTFSSSSNGGTTGSLKIFSRASTIEKEAAPLEDYGADSFGIADIEDLRVSVIRDTSPSTATNQSVFYTTASVTSSFYTGSNSLSKSDFMDWSYFSTASLMKVGKDAQLRAPNGDYLKPYPSMMLVFRGTGEAGQIDSEDLSYTNAASEGDSPPSRYLVTSNSYGGTYDDRKFLPDVEIRYTYMYSGSIRPGGQQGTADLMTNIPEDPASSGGGGEEL